MATKKRSKDEKIAKEVVESAALGAAFVGGIGLALGAAPVVVTAVGGSALAEAAAEETIMFGDGFMYIYGLWDIMGKPFFACAKPLDSPVKIADMCTITQNNTPNNTQYKLVLGNDCTKTDIPLICRTNNICTSSADSTVFYTISSKIKNHLNKNLKDTLINTLNKNCNSQNYEKKTAQSI